jgi:hypothetical protein
MSKFPIKSVFEQIAKEVFVLNNVSTAKETINSFLSEKKINEIDKKTILFNVNKCTNMYHLNRYICNSLLKFEGLSVN